MITITKKENLVLNQIKYLQSDYKDGVPQNILKLDLDISEIELKEILENLNGKGILHLSNDRVMVNDGDFKIKVVETKEEVKKEDLDQLEKKALEVIKALAGDSGLISRNLLDGHLLYGDLKLNTLKAYNLILALENKGLIKKIHKVDGEYYSL